MKKLLIVGLVLLLLAGVLLTMSCQTEPEEETNPFVGTWENENNGYRIEFTKTVATGYYPNLDIYWTGNYIYDKTRITVELDQEKSADSMLAGWGNTFIAEYRFENDKLIFNGNKNIKIK